MHFAPHSFVYFDGCSSGSNAAHDMMLAFKQAGASMYAGWTTPVKDTDAAFAAQYLFDRMLGANAFYPRQPPQRPFNLMNVAWEMGQLNYDRSVICDSDTTPCPPSDIVTSTLKVFTLNDQAPIEFGLLAPTIDRGETVRPPCCAAPSRIDLELHGLFGSQQGKVLVGGAPLTVLSWVTDTIRAELPPNGPGSAGDISVSVRDHTSNAVPLTEWQVRIRWRQDYGPMFGPGPYAEVTCDLHLRSEFHRSRSNSGLDPVWPDYVPVEPAQDSRCDWAMGGSATYTEISTGHVQHLVLSGSGEFHWRPDGTGPGPWLGVSGYIQPAKSQLFIAILGEAMGTWRVYEDGVFQYTTDQILAGTGPVTLPLDAGFNILPGMSTFDSSSDGPSTTTWGQTPAQNAPNDQTPG
jgi:hypothetical protein